MNRLLLTERAAPISFLQGEALTNSVIAALATRGDRIYRANKHERGRVQFKDDLKRLLMEIATDYNRPVCDEAHIANIEHLSNEMSVRHGCILNDGRFRIGVAQKALNLFLKYAWALELISAPPHCPFDGAVLGELLDRDDPCRRWTSVDCVCCYQRWVTEARKKLYTCGPCTSLSDWEHCVWRRKRKVVAT